jgi:hypothetical protein
LAHLAGPGWNAMVGRLDCTVSFFFFPFGLI